MNMIFEEAVSFFSVLIVILFIARVLIHYFYTGKNPLTIGAGKNTLRNIKERISVLGLVFFIVFSFSFGFFETWNQKVSLISFLNQWAYRTGGLLLVSLALLLLIAALFQMGKSWRVGIDEDTKDQLVTWGIFSFSRNPIYLSMDFIFIGFFLAIPNWLFFGAAAIALIGIHFQIRDEEKFLSEHYGSSYLKYRQKTGRYFTIRTFKV